MTAADEASRGGRRGAGRRSAGRPAGRPDAGRPRGDQPVGDLPAGDFSEWLREVRAALAQGGDAVVPCGDCRACCTSSYFVHIGPDELDTLEHIPPEVLFAAPGAPSGTRVMGYDARGRCPMFADGDCSVYAHRPRTCRVYDCRVFAATGIEPDRPAIAAQARRWVFGYPFEGDRQEAEAVKAAAALLREHPEDFTEGRTPATPAELAVAAIEWPARADRP